jgi:hypothetical protein
MDGREEDESDWETGFQGVNGCSKAFGDQTNLNIGDLVTILTRLPLMIEIQQPRKSDQNKNLI